MEEVSKVFASNIIRENKTSNSHLYELLEIKPAKPLPKDDPDMSTSCDFSPKTDKYYVPKKKSKLKVRTVRNVREQLEKDVYEELNSEMEKHKNILLRKIRIGSSRQEATKKIAKGILRSSSPICKDVWQMLTYLNPEDHSHSAQFVLWNRKSIQINGSKGGRNKFICNFDVGKDNVNLKGSLVKSNHISQRNKILHNSLNVKFKPGPLSKKAHLDYSYQKFQYGDCTVVSLPKPALDVKPLYGTPLTSTMINFLSGNFMQNADGIITEKWAEFSLSTLGVIKRGTPVQSEKGACVSFDLQYKCNQNRILMRYGTRNSKCETLSYENEKCLSPEAEIDIVLSKILDYVEIKLEVERLHAKEDEMDCSVSDVSDKIDLMPKDKNKRKFCELDRLDVTVIKLSSAETEKVKCTKDYCSLGCICSSLECSYNLKTHCGRTECIFECKCFNSNRWSSPHAFHKFSGLEDLNKKINSGLAKEEQKFRQTVILSGEKSIMLKSERRNWKSCKRYADFYSNMCLKSVKESRKELLILTPKLPCDNIEPWCMVHNLYKCFCKGKFTERKLNTLDQSDTSDEVTDVIQPTEIKLVEKPLIEPPKTRSSLRINDGKKDISAIKNTNVPNVIEVESSIVQPEVTECDGFQCARVIPYSGRKFNNEYYLETNRKIVEMEKNDRRLVKKMENLMKINIENEEPQPQQGQLTSNKNDRNELDYFPKLCKDFFDKLPYNPKMVAWIIACYKHCKKCKSQGKIEKFLRPPRFMRVGFYTWEFILSRYNETKNFFLVTPEKPHKIFVAINQKHPRLKSFINIKDLSLDDVQNYPDEVQNLRKNAVAREDTFWILRGLPYCWEFYGVVKKKVSEHMGDDNIICSLKCEEQEPLDIGKGPLSICYGFSDDEPEESNSNSISIDIENNDDDVINIDEDVLYIENDDTKFNETKINENITNPMTKWYVMIVEDDFNELHFFNKGFFVQYDHIVQAINVSQTSKKTVKLYCQKRNSNSEESIDFGIYAIPNDNRNVVIGPYEPNEPLGIEIVKTLVPKVNVGKTRGMCIAIKRKDITKLLDESLSFIPPDVGSQNMIPLEKELSKDIKKNPTSSTSDNVIPTDSGQGDTKDKSKIESPIKAPQVTKPIKPIKIRKSDGFYCVYPKFPNSPKSSALAIIPKACLPKPIQQKFGAGVVSPQRLAPKPVAEIAPQVKSSEVETKTKFQGGMSVLKPEEINKRILESLPGPSFDTLYSNLDKDIENYLATASECTLPDEDEVYVISDDEPEDKIVWIRPTTIPSLGCIPAKVNADEHISFEFPGFKYTDFYPKDEAFRKINLVLSRKVYVPKQLKVQWEVIEVSGSDTAIKKLEESDLTADLILTNQGLKKRVEVIKRMKPKKQSPVNSEAQLNTKKIEHDSNLAENTDTLVSKKEHIVRTLSKADDKERQEMADRLSTLLSETES